MKWFKRIILALLVLFILAAGTIAAAYYYVLPSLPDVATLKTVKLQTPLRIYSHDGKLISQFGEKRRIPLSLDEIPKHLIEAVLATEDARFYEHNGIDPIGILRAAVVMIATGEKKQGASTITMQVARNFFLTRDKTFIRKIKEIFIALHIEQLLTKNEILELYFNRIYLGQRAYGIGAAAQVYYGKTAKELTLAQMAVIAGLPKAPSSLNPITSSKRALARRNVVLRRMLDVGYITKAEYQNASSEPITARYHGAEIDLYAPYISEMARDYMVGKYGEEEAYTGGYEVHTSIDSRLQLIAQQSLKENVFAYDERHGYRGVVAHLWTGDKALAHDEILKKLDQSNHLPELTPAAVMYVGEQYVQVVDDKGNMLDIYWDGLKWARPYINDKKQGASPKTAADILTFGDQIWIRSVDIGKDKEWRLAQIPEVSSAMVSIEPYNGAIRALVGGFSFSLSQYNRVTQAKRQLGSNIKPFVYAAALEKGYTLATLVNNAPINEPDIRQGIAWRPKNSPNVYGGPTRLRIGLAQSINVMSVRTMRYVGLDDTITKLEEFGFDSSELPRNESIALGSPSVTPLQVARAFTAFANGGYLVDPFYIDYIKNADGKIIEKSSPTLACTPEPKGDTDDSMHTLAAELAKDEQQNNDQPSASDLLTEMQDESTPFEQCNAPNARHGKQIISQQTAFLITDALKSVIWGGGDWRHKTGWNGTAWRASRVVKRHDIAGKTGTTNESRDSWFSGFNPELETTVWVGFDDHNRELGRTSWNTHAPKDQISGAESGAKTAGPAWNEYMKLALQGTPEKPVVTPKEIISARVDRATGELTHKTDYTSRFEYFIKGTEPTEYVDTPQSNTDFFGQDNSNNDDSSSDELFQ